MSKLRNKIEHRHIDREEVGIMIFGECQALLYNYENTLIDFFGEEWKRKIIDKKFKKK